jgi:hypothetical protein
VTITVGRGADAAESIGSIAERMGLSRRRVERELEQRALDGEPIVACERGVYLATSPLEARQYADSLRGRIRAVQQRVSALERWADDNDEYGQVALWDRAA